MNSGRLNLVNEGYNKLQIYVKKIIELSATKSSTNEDEKQKWREVDMQV